MRLQVIPDPSRLKQWVAYRVQDVCWDEEKDRIGYEGTNQSGRQTLNGVHWGMAAGDRGEPRLRNDSRVCAPKLNTPKVARGCATPPKYEYIVHRKHRGPGLTGDTRAHTGTRITRTNLTTIQTQMNRFLPGRCGSNQPKETDQVKVITL